MSQSAALINLVRLNPVSDTEPNDYKTGRIFKEHDEVKLVDPDGTPCAWPRPISFVSKDPVYNYITGDTGRNARQLTRRITLDIDFFDAELHQRLEEWMHHRAKVLIAPGFGRETALAYRPVRIIADETEAGDDARDITGNELVKIEQPEDPYIWDEATGAFLPSAANTVPALNPLKTKYGAAYRHPGPQANRMYPTSPEGAEQGLGSGDGSGWTKAGTDSTQLLFTFATWADPFPDTTGFLRVAYSASASTSRFIEVEDIWTSGHADESFLFTGSGTAVAIVWLRGQMPDGAKLVFGSGAFVSEVDLAGMNFKRWTPIKVAKKLLNWATDQATMRLELSSTVALGGTIEIGPVQVTYESGASAPASFYWNHQNAKESANAYAVKTQGSFHGPHVGTLFMSFFVPEDVDEVTAMGSQDIGLLAGGAEFIRITVGEASTNIIILTTGGIYSSILTGGLVAGEINTLAWTYGAGDQAMYHNGELIDTWDGSTFKTSPPFQLGDSAAAFGVDATGNTCSPVKLLSARVDAGAWSASDVKNNHLALVDPIAVAVARACRGRVFRIVSIPGTVRSGYGTSQITGQLVLEQVEYLHHLADPLNEEGSTP